MGYIDIADYRSSNFRDTGIVPRYIVTLQLINISPKIAKIACCSGVSRGSHDADAPQLKRL